MSRSMSRASSAKGREELTGSDLPNGSLAPGSQAQPHRRRFTSSDVAALPTAKFNDHELAETGHVAARAARHRRSAAIKGDGAGGKGSSWICSEAPARETPVTIHFHFNLTPTAFLGDDERFAPCNSALLPAKSSKSRRNSPSPASVTKPCLAATATPENGVFTNQDGKVDDRLYVVGWAKRGPSGTIPTNRVEAQQVAHKMAQEI